MYCPNCGCLTLDKDCEYCGPSELYINKEKYCEDCGGINLSESPQPRAETPGKE